MIHIIQERNEGSDIFGN